MFFCFLICCMCHPISTKMEEARFMTCAAACQQAMNKTLRLHFRGSSHVVHLYIQSMDTKLQQEFKIEKLFPARRFTPYLYKGSRISCESSVFIHWEPLTQTTITLPSLPGTQHIGLLMPPRGQKKKSMTKLKLLSLQQAGSGRCVRGGRRWWGHRVF